jgi:hypothetical protein
MYMQVLESENLWKTHVVCVKDNYSISRWSQFYFIMILLIMHIIVNLISIRSFEGYNMACLMVLKKKEIIRLKVLF